jgi:hypothetical protein
VVEVPNGEDNRDSPIKQAKGSTRAGSGEFLMPWKPSSARKKTHRAKTKRQQRQWSAVANSMLKRGESEGSAIRAANGVLKRRGKRPRSRR